MHSQWRTVCQQGVNSQVATAAYFTCFLFSCFILCFNTVIVPLHRFLYKKMACKLSVILNCSPLRSVNFSSLLNLLHMKMYVGFIVFHKQCTVCIVWKCIWFYIFCSCFAFVPLPTTCVWIIHRVWCKETKTVCVAHLGFSTVYVTLCLRYSMYWFPRYNVSFRQHFCTREGQGHAADQDPGQGHLSNSDEEGGITRRRVPRRTSSEIASAKIAGRPIPGKVRRNGTFHAWI